MKTVSTIKIVLNEEELTYLKNSADILNGIFGIMRDYNLKEIPIVTDETEEVDWENTYDFDFLEKASQVLDCF